MVVSASKQRADDFSTFCHRLITTIPILYHLEPNDNQRSSKIAWDVAPTRPAHAPSVKSVGIFGQMTGSRATDIIADDIEVPGNSATQDMREKLTRAADEFNAIIMPGQHSSITMLGTPQSEETIYNTMRERGYERKIWPARVPLEDKIEAYQGDLAPSVQKLFEKGYHWAPVDPKRFDDDDLRERQLSYGMSGFMLQFMLDTSLSDQEKYPLKLKDLIVMSTNSDRAPVTVQYGSGPDQALKFRNLGFSGDRFFGPLYFDRDNWSEYEGSMMFIDPAGRGADETGYAVVKQLHGTLWCTDCGGFHGGYENHVLVKLAKIAKREKVNLIQVESNFGDGMFSHIFQPVLQKYHKCRIEEKRVSQQKEKRIIETLEPVMNSHRLVIDQGIVERELKMVDEDPNKLPYSLFFQMTRLCNERGALRHDDRLDALAQAVEYWMESMARDEEQSVEKWKEEQLEKELERFKDHVFGWKNTQPTRWIDRL